MSKFTEGPWQSQHDYDLEGEMTIIGAIDGPDDGRWHYQQVAEVCSEHDVAEARANVRLIVAAPDLLKACKELIKAFQFTATSFEGALAANRAYDAGKAAIAKAEGRP